GSVHDGRRVRRRAGPQLRGRRRLLRCHPTSVIRWWHPGPAGAAAFRGPVRTVRGNARL
ncbi:MAG: hypothetical protein AVDCRST_MAG83-1880, partial [uncultured Arthrobacter sp.]